MDDPKIVFRKAARAKAQTLPELLNLAFEAGGECNDLWNAGGSDSPLSDALAAAINAAQDCAGAHDTEKIKAALRLCLTALEPEYGTTPADEQYDNLVDRIRSVLGVQAQAEALVEDIMGGGESPKDALSKAKAAKADQGEVPTVELGTILGLLPEEVTDQIMDALNSGQDQIAITRQLKAILQPHAQTLEAAGVVPDYLAYMIIFAASQSQGQ